MPYAGTKKCTLSDLEHEQEQLNKDIEVLRQGKNTLYQDRIHDRIPCPQDCVDHHDHGFSLHEAMKIAEEDMPLVQLGMMESDIVKEHEWLKNDYEEAWPVQVRGLASSNRNLPRNRRGINVATLNGTSDSDTELGSNQSRLGDDHVKSDETCLKVDGHSESDEVYDSDEHVENPKFPRKVPKKGTKRAGQSHADLTRHCTQVNHQVKGHLRTSHHSDNISDEDESNSDDQRGMSHASGDETDDMSKSTATLAKGTSLFLPSSHPLPKKTGPLIENELEHSSKGTMTTCWHKTRESSEPLVLLASSPSGSSEAYSITWSHIPASASSAYFASSIFCTSSTSGPLPTSTPSAPLPLLVDLVKLAVWLGMGIWLGTVGNDGENMEK
ncbi:uncharacterized protein EI90DRAFT_3016298 [Cantharellus anzutake]|uniref:uncharacterized protein n=1 Tax=Cantharellus anzutake TaxID=1750568 RepID=UPI0019082615|nr:uncharacterized protein EI90DRAFT_3016298 [Cantharellus anzutake]KAF8331760.1 hypothetical protein EI90DRAFT_3016298 [Cantharellus anzutake]